MRNLLMPLYLIVLFAQALAGNSALADASGPIGAPGIEHTWAPALKQAIGTSYEKVGAKSPIWFTVAEGILSEVFYPQVDQAQIGDLQILVSDGKKFFSEQKRDCDIQVEYLNDEATVQIQSHHRGGAYDILQKIVTDPNRAAVRIHTFFRSNKPSLHTYLLFKPAIQNSGKDNIGFISNGMLVASRENAEHRRANSKAFAALAVSTGFSKTGVGYVGHSDGWQDLSKNHRLTEVSQKAGPGNVALTGELPLSTENEMEFDISLAFATSAKEAETNAQLSLLTDFNSLQVQYEQGWKDYLKSLEKNKPGLFFKTNALARRSALVIKMHEDKKNRGAIVASMSKPAIPDGERASNNAGGYHLVWPRDLYHAAMGLLAAGDYETPVAVLNHLVSRQKPDGSWPQNYWVNGTPYWSATQMDEVSFPIILASRLLTKKIAKSNPVYIKMIEKAAQYIALNGPFSSQDRWEENSGYIPSTIAAEISALNKATELTGNPEFAKIAAKWSSHLENWMVVPTASPGGPRLLNGSLAKNYYLRVSPNGIPHEPAHINIANGIGDALASEILDGGFLELVRLGVRKANDPFIMATLAAYENPANGVALSDDSASAYRRYNRDGYGAQHVGGFWPLLAGERGHYAIAAQDFTRAKAQLNLLENTALTSGMIPEQTVTASGEATLGVACPLVWAHAELLLLNRSLEEGRVFDSP